MPAESKAPASPPTPTNQFDVHSARMENVFIGISGLIGAGKSTLATALAKRLRLPVYYEPVKNNEYLEDFYKDIKKHGFAMQVYLLNKRFQQQQEIIWQGKGGVQDRTIYEDSIFAKMLRDVGLMDERDYQTYRSLFQNMSNFMKKPNIIVHLDVSPEESFRRITMRNRGCESGITLEYLQNLHTAYEVFIQEISRIIPVIKIDYETFRSVEDMAAAIATEYERLSCIRSVSWESQTLITPKPPRSSESKSTENNENNPPVTPTKAKSDKNLSASTCTSTDEIVMSSVLGDRTNN